MDIQKEKEAFLNVFQFFKSFKGIGFSEETEQFFLKKNKPNDAECLDVSNLNQMWRAWWARAKAQAVPEWIDYTKQSPRIDGRYQIFISGEQITADWQSPFGFSDPVEGDALIQELISHWAMLPEPPNVQEQGHETSF